MKGFEGVGQNVCWTFGFVCVMACSSMAVGVVLEEDNIEGGWSSGALVASVREILRERENRLRKRFERDLEEDRETCTRLLSLIVRDHDSLREEIRQLGEMVGRKVDRNGTKAKTDTSPEGKDESSHTMEAAELEDNAIVGDG